MTFYKAVIPAEYWSEFKRGLPKEASVNVKRWPGVNGKQDGLDLVEPDGRREVLGALTNFFCEMNNLVRTDKMFK